MKATKSNGRKKTLGAGKRLRLVSEGGWEFVERVGSSGVVSIVAVTDAGELVLTEQVRRSVGGPVIDLPAGLVGDEKGARRKLPGGGPAGIARGDGVCRAAIRVARRVAHVARADVRNGRLRSALGLKKVAAGGGVDKEKITVHCVQLARAAAWLRRRANAGVQVDVKTYAGLYFAGAAVARRTTK